MCQRAPREPSRDPWTVGAAFATLRMLMLDPGGWIPKWLVNYFATIVARSTFGGLRRQVSRHLYSPSQLRAMRERIEAYAKVAPP